jgi:hypothetical protein
VAVNSIYASIILSYKYNLVLKSFSYGTQVMGHPVYTYSGEIDRTGLKILENNKNIQSIISVNTNILLRRFRLKFLRIMYCTSCYKERLNFENTLYNRKKKFFSYLLTYKLSEDHIETFFGQLGQKDFRIH